MFHAGKLSDFVTGGPSGQIFLKGSAYALLHDDNNNNVNLYIRQK